MCSVLAPLIRKFKTWQGCHAHRTARDRQNRCVCHRALLAIATRFQSASCCESSPPATCFEILATCFEIQATPSLRIASPPASNSNSHHSPLTRRRLSVEYTRQRIYECHTGSFHIALPNGFILGNQTTSKPSLCFSIEVPYCI